MGTYKAPQDEWTIATSREYFEALHEADKRFEEERDRRYTEVNIEKEKALKIKETADLAALSLAREIQTYKDEKANELREQINSERGHYASKDDLSNLDAKFDTAMKPITAYVAAQSGGSQRITQFMGWIFAAGAIIVAVVGYIISNS